MCSLRGGAKRSGSYLLGSGKMSGSMWEKLGETMVMSPCGVWVVWGCGGEG